MFHFAILSLWLIQLGNSLGLRGLEEREAVPDFSDFEVFYDDEVHKYSSEKIKQQLNNREETFTSAGFEFNNMHKFFDGTASIKLEKTVFGMQTVAIKAMIWPKKDSVKAPDNTVGGFLDCFRGPQVFGAEDMDKIATAKAGRLSGQPQEDTRMFPFERTAFYSDDIGQTYVVRDLLEDSPEVLYEVAKRSEAEGTKGAKLISFVEPRICSCPDAIAPYAKALLVGAKHFEKNEAYDVVVELGEKLVQFGSPLATTVAYSIVTSYVLEKKSRGEPSDLTDKRAYDKVEEELNQLEAIVAKRKEANEAFAAGEVVQELGANFKEFLGRLDEAGFDYGNSESPTAQHLNKIIAFLKEGDTQLFDEKYQTFNVSSDPSEHVGTLRSFLRTIDPPPAPQSAPKGALRSKEAASKRVSLAA